MEIQTRVRVKEWGNSLGIVIPREIVIKEDIHQDDEITITVAKEHTLRGFFGKGKGIKIDTQKMKDEVRKEWKMD